MNANSTIVVNPKRSPPTPLMIWQWNCRSYRGKQNSLSLFANVHSPAVIALQETGTDQITLRGYTTFITDPASRTATLVQTTQTAQAHTLPTTLDYVFVELIPKKKTQASLFILNIYSPPSSPLNEIDRLFKTVRQRTKGHGLVIIGDFNAHHTIWGYHRDNKKGRQLHEAIRQNNLHLCNAPDTPTRMGNSVSRDTTPDLTLTYGLKDPTWECLTETLGSDHYIIQLQLPHHEAAAQRIRTARLTDWRKFREITPTSPIHAIEEWTAQMLEAAKKHTKELPLTQDCPAIDAHLLHLWEARRGLTKRWKKRRTNRKLRLRIAQITLEAATYAIHLSQQNWSQFCTKLQDLAWKNLTHYGLYKPYSLAGSPMARHICPSKEPKNQKLILPCAKHTRPP
ncbi:uncharacterized protein LOC115327171 [Ixodes scapularis]|uniref:uncharacterized protein LOC115327171 n=1 Tax=Ixodes scapularis TaxID=6945 RepID=UPI001A9CE9CB|nr:uncharacterized protein LOC115327171 [Ixodes scapularis]